MRSPRQFNSRMAATPNIFQQILTTFGNCDIDLLATRLNTQLKQFVSWRPDPEAMGADVLQLCCIALPPFFLIGRYAKKFGEDRACLILVTPIWRSQLWCRMTRTISRFSSDPARVSQCY